MADDTLTELRVDSEVNELYDRLDYLRRRADLSDDAMVSILDQRHGGDFAEGYREWIAEGES